MKPLVAVLFFALTPAFARDLNPTELPAAWSHRFTDGSALLSNNSRARTSAVAPATGNVQPAITSSQTGKIPLSASSTSRTPNVSGDIGISIASGSSPSPYHRPAAQVLRK